jgi:hypothetical protein
MIVAKLPALSRKPNKPANTTTASQMTPSRVRTRPKQPAPSIR